MLLDIGLPKMHGFKLLHDLRMSPEITPCPVIVLTGDPSPELEERAHRAGVAAFFRKPVSQRQLVQAAVDVMLYS